MSTCSPAPDRVPERRPRSPCNTPTGSQDQGVHDRHFHIGRRDGCGRAACAGHEIRSGYQDTVEWTFHPRQHPGEIGAREAQLPQRGYRVRPVPPVPYEPDPAARFETAEEAVVPDEQARVCCRANGRTETLAARARRGGGCECKATKTCCDGCAAPNRPELHGHTESVATVGEGGVGDHPHVVRGRYGRADEVAHGLQDVQHRRAT
jgi:hypothetical protein